MRTIKRYSNRKLYDTFDKHYVTLADVAGFVRNGDEVKVTDHVSGADLTSATLAQIIFEEEKKTPRLTVAGLRKIIQGGIAALGGPPPAPGVPNGAPPAPQTP